MKRIEAIIRPDQLKKLVDDLSDIGCKGLTVLDVRGCGQQKGHRERYIGSEYSTILLSKTMVILYVPDDQVGEVVETIAESARTGERGDGKVAVSELVEVVRVRTGDRNEDAI